MSIPDDIIGLKQLVSILIEKITSLENEVKDLKIENTSLRIENAELKSSLNQNSSNSSKPPSSDYFNIKPAFSKASNYKKGGQSGHKGDTLQQLVNPDKIIECRPSECECGHKYQSNEMFLAEKRQVFDLPQPKLEVIEYQIFGVKCSKCGNIHKGISPSNVNSPVQYGNGVRAYLTMLSVTYKLPYKKIQQIFKDLFGYSVNESTIYSANKRCFDSLSVSEQKILKKILEEQVVHADETGIKIEKDNYWLHTLSSHTHTYQFVHKKRGKEALSSESSIINNLTSWLVHDCWSSYFNLENVKHSLCGAHLIRELQGVIENNQSKWAKDLRTLLLDVHNMTLENRMKNRDILEKRFGSICALGNFSEPPPIKIPSKRGRLKKTKARNLVERLIKHQTAVLAFAFNPDVPFTNNQAERDLRPAKLKLKISNCFRSFEGAKVYARIESFVSTASKNNQNIFTELRNSFDGQNFLTLQCT